MVGVAFEQTHSPNLAVKHNEYIHFSGIRNACDFTVSINATRVH